MTSIDYNLDVTATLIYQCCVCKNSGNGWTEDKEHTIEIPTAALNDVDSMNEFADLFNQLPQDFRDFIEKACK